MEQTSSEKRLQSTDVHNEGPMTHKATIDRLPIKLYVVVLLLPRKWEMVLKNNSVVLETHQLGSTELKHEEHFYGSV